VCASFGRKFRQVSGAEEREVPRRGRRRSRPAATSVEQFRPRSGARGLKGRADGTWDLAYHGRSEILCSFCQRRAPLDFRMSELAGDRG
jgi:hypothetical protein